jgi:hypothetical protein
MKPYKLIHGDNDNITTFETAVIAALEEGYEFASRLITKVVTNANGNNKVLFFQPMVFDESLSEIYEEDEDNESV